METTSEVPTYIDFDVYLETEGEKARTIYPDVHKNVALYDEEIYNIVINNKFSGRILADIRLSGVSIGKLMIPPNKCQKIERPIDPRLPARKLQFIKFGGALAHELSVKSNEVNCDEIQVVITPENMKQPKPQIKTGLRVVYDGIQEKNSNRGCTILSATNSTQEFTSCPSFETKGVFYFTLFLRAIEPRKAMRIEED